MDHGTVFFGPLTRGSARGETAENPWTRHFRHLSSAGDRPEAWQSSAGGAAVTGTGLWSQVRRRIVCTRFIPWSSCARDNGSSAAMVDRAKALVCTCATRARDLVAAVDGLTQIRDANEKKSASCATPAEISDRSRPRDVPVVVWTRVLPLTRKVFKGFYFFFIFFSRKK